MSTVQELITGSFLDINATAAGESPNDSELADGLVRLNALALSLNAEGATLWEKLSETKLLTAGAGQMTMGPTGGFVTARPTRILGARCFSGTYGRGLRIITDPNEWASIVERDSSLTLPLKLYVDYDYPNVTLHFWPAPTVGASLTINTLESFTSMPPDTNPAMIQQFAQTSLLRRTKTFTLVNGTGSYTMGPGATFNAGRPTQVISAHVGFGSYGHEVEIIGAPEWSMILEAEGAGIILPMLLYPQYGFPDATMNFWPVPGNSVTAELHSPRQIAAFADLATTISLPPGFERMLRTNLALDLFPQYIRNRDIPQSLVGIAADAKASVIAANVAAGIVPGAQQQAQQAAQPPAQG